MSNKKEQRTGEGESMTRGTRLFLGGIVIIWAAVREALCLLWNVLPKHGTHTDILFEGRSLSQVSSWEELGLRGNTVPCPRGCHVLGLL